jgi:hypothetical protein
LHRVLLIWILLGLAASAPRTLAVTNIFISVADTSLLEINPTNNLGGFAGMNGGTTQEFKKTRALLRFDLTSLPTNAIILAASLKLEVTREPDETPNNTPFGLHRMLRSWGEGDKSPVTQPGKGLPASPGEATWECAFHPTNAWSVPGGAPDVDYSSVESSSQFIYGIGESPYYFETTPELVGDVTTWVRNPIVNFGWMLLCNDEASNFTARRFGTREDISYSPELEVHYLIPPQIGSVQKFPGHFNFHFQAHAGQTYEIEYRTSLTSGNWQTLAQVGPFPANTSVWVVDSSGAPQRFYRLRTW